MSAIQALGRLKAGVQMLGYARCATFCQEGLHPPYIPCLMSQFVAWNRVRMQTIHRNLHSLVAIMYLTCLGWHAAAATYGRLPCSSSRGAVLAGATATK